MQSFIGFGRAARNPQQQFIAIFGLVLLSVPCCAIGQTIDLASKPLQFLISQTVVSDNNLFRQPDQQSVFQSNPVSGLISATRLQASWRGGAGMQTYDVQGSLDQLLYPNYASINHLDYRLSGRWKMAFPGDWSGSTELSLSKNQPARSELLGQETNRITQTNLAVNLFKSLAPTTQGFTKLDIQRRDNSSILRSSANFKLDAFDLGARYRPNVAQEATLAVRQSNGRYGSTVFDEDRFSENTLSVSGLSEQGSNNVVTAQLGFKRRSYKQREDRNFSGPFAELRYIVPLTSAVTIDTRLGIGTDATSITDSTYARGRSVSIKPSWQLTTKTRIDGSLDYSNAKFIKRFDDSILQSAVPARSETVQGHAVSATHSLYEAVNVSLRVANDQRRSSDPSRNFKATSLTLSVQLEL